MFAVIFYLLAAVIVFSTAMAVTRRNTMHAVVYAVVSFFATAVLFALLGAPLVAVFEIIIYAGAIMVLFLFIIMLNPRSRLDPRSGPGWRWLVPLALSAVILGCVAALSLTSPEAGQSLRPAMADPAELGLALYRRHWLVVELVSLVLFVGLAGACFLGRAHGAVKEGGE